MISGGLSFLNYSLLQFLSYVEYVIREDEESSNHLDDLYDIALIQTDSRRQAIMDAMAAFGG